MQLHRLRIEEFGVGAETDGMISSGRLFLLATLLSIICGAGSKPAKILLEVADESGGMVAKPYQNLVTLRVFEDGKAEWRPTADAPLQPAQLSSGEVAHLGTIIHSPAVRRLRRQYGPFAEYIDSWFIRDFKFYVGKYERHVTVSNMDTVKKHHEEMPDGMVALVCETARLQARLASDDTRDDRFLKACEDDPAGRR